MFSQLIYWSRNKVAPSRDGSYRKLMDSLLSVSRPNNHRDGITGFLISDGVWFMQILEGDPEAVSRTYQRIQRDPRHGSVTQAALRTIRTRSFPSWSMGASLRTAERNTIFARHGVGQALDPSELLAPTMLALAMDLQDAEMAENSHWLAAS